MISVQEAREMITQNSSQLSPVKVSLKDAFSKVLAENLYSKIDIPAFNQSAMDGYAFRFEDWKINNDLIIKGESPAGLTKSFELGTQQAVRIFTGAPLPAGADTVIAQENISVQKNHLIINDKLLQPGSNVRSVGSEIKANTLAMAKGSVLTPAAIGFLSGIGIHEASVYPAPVIKIIVTGNELASPGTNLQFGQVYESNSFTLLAALQQMHLPPANITHVADDYEKLKNIIQDLLAQSDILLITGGVSVGDYDYTAKALHACGVEQVFHKIKQKPGKPLFFGRKNNKLVFGLPGNPSSVLTCFYEYVYPCIKQLMGFTNTNLSKRNFTLSHDYSKKTGLTHFVKAVCNNKEVTALHAQESYKMQSFAVSNCLICLEEEPDFYKKGDIVEVHLLPE